MSVMARFDWCHSDRLTKLICRSGKIRSSASGKQHPKYLETMRKLEINGPATLCHEAFSWCHVQLITSRELWGVAFY